MAIAGAGGCSPASTSALPTGTPTSTSPSVPPSAAPTPIASPTPIPTVAPAPTATPTPTVPRPASALPKVNSCDPQSVPGSVTQTAPAVPGKSFVLHVPVLMYHRIVPVAEVSGSNRGLVVPPTTFDKQMTALANAGWKTITAATLAHDLASRIRPPAKSFVITFDDGWADGFKYAFPILRKHGFVASYYVISERIDQPGFLSSAELQALVASGNEIGDHTVSHKSLPSQAPSDLKTQVDQAASRIAQVTGQWPVSLAYPYGRKSTKVLAGVAACPVLQIAFLESSRPSSSGGAPVQSTETWADRFVTPRIRVSAGLAPSSLLRYVGN